MTSSHFKTAPLRELLAEIIDYRGQSVPKSDSGILLITARNVREGRLDFTEKEYISEIAYETWMTRGKPRAGDVIFTTEAPLGNAVLFPDGKYALGQRTIVLRPKDHVLDSEYLVQFLLSPIGKRRIDFRATGSTAKGVKSSELRKIRVDFPEIEEQRKIALLLSTWDVAIKKTEQLIAANERHFSGLVRQLITERANSESSWKRQPISEIAERIQRQTDGGSYPLLTISSASGFVRQEEKYSRYMAGESAKTYTLLRAGEFAYNKGNSLRFEFGCIFQLQDYEAALVPSVYVSFRLHDSACASYMRHLFAADYLKPQLRALVKTGVRNNGLLNIRPDEFMGTTVPMPPLAEQERISRVLDAARQEIALLTKQLVALRNQKRGLMQKLLTGQWRVNAPKEVCA